MLDTVLVGSGTRLGTLSGQRVGDGLARLLPTSRSAFRQFVHINQVPFICVGRKEIIFSEQQVRVWLAHRSSTGEA